MSRRAGQPSAERAAGSDRALRFLLGAVGLVLVGYGLLRLLQAESNRQLTGLAVWLGAALVVHDGILVPALIAVGLLVNRLVPLRWRRFVQPALVTMALVSSVGVILIWRQGRSSAASLALLQRDYARNLLLLIGIIVLVTVAVAASVTARARNVQKSRPPTDH
jgi:hypothetical protein